MRRRSKMKEKFKEKKPYYLIIARKIIFWLVMLMLLIAVLKYTIFVNAVISVTDNL